jgi:hypothetical protein
MEEHRGKMKNTKFVILMLFLGILGAKKAAALPAFNFYAGFANAWTSTSTTDVGYHVGWNASADVNWNIRVLLPHSASRIRSSTASILISPGFRGQFLDLAASNWLADGSRYRAWSAFGLGPEIGVGLNISHFGISRGQTFLLSTALLGNVAHYTQTSLYNAYMSWLIKASWDLELKHGWAVSTSFPVEFAYRADGRSIVSGLGIGVKYAF